MIMTRGRLYEEQIFPLIAFFFYPPYKLEKKKRKEKKKEGMHEGHLRLSGGPKVG